MTEIIKTACPLKLVMGIAGGKWKSSIVCLLADGKQRRYSEIRRVLPGITNTMLSQSLKELEADHILVRLQYNEMPVRVEYRITPEGQALQKALDLLNAWGVEYMRHHDLGQPFCPECSFGNHE